MSDTPKLADECQRLLDNGWIIILFRSELGSYTAAAYPPEVEIELEGDATITDDFLPSQALYRLTEKVFGEIA